MIEGFGSISKHCQSSVYYDQIQVPVVVFKFFIIIRSNSVQCGTCIRKASCYNIPLCFLFFQLEWSWILILHRCRPWALFCDCYSSRFRVKLWVRFKFHVTLYWLTFHFGNGFIILSGIWLLVFDSHWRLIILTIDHPSLKLNQWHVQPSKSCVMILTVMDR